MEPTRKIRRYFTKADYEEGLCDAHGRAIEGGPKNPPVRPSLKDINEAKDKGLPLPSSRPYGEDRELKQVKREPEILHLTPGSEAVDPLTLDPPLAETGVPGDAEANPKE